MLAAGVNLNANNRPPVNRARAEGIARGQPVDRRRNPALRVQPDSEDDSDEEENVGYGLHPPVVHSSPTDSIFIFFLSPCTGHRPSPLTKPDHNSLSSSDLPHNSPDPADPAPSSSSNGPSQYGNAIFQQQPSTVAPKESDQSAHSSFLDTTETNGQTAPFHTTDLPTFGLPP
uniref:Uncharacterized protein n=1 Tax=Populus alba TaxID=43335 RepID=A0A4V6A5Q5_POPAL|nr:hypothetical protein D5086_0000219920 [Populus alba]